MITGSGVIAAGRPVKHVAQHCVIADGRIVEPGGVGSERLFTDGGVVDAGGVVLERATTDGRVVARRWDGIYQRTDAESSVAVFAADLWTLRAGGWCKHEQCERGN